MQASIAEDRIRKWGGQAETGTIENNVDKTAET